MLSWEEKEIMGARQGKGILYPRAWLKSFTSWEPGIPAQLTKIAVKIAYIEIIIFSHTSDLNKNVKIATSHA